MTATIFGPDWNQLTLDAVRNYLADAEDEPLLWEAKGAESGAGHVRRTVCAFANSHDGGYLILGADETSSGFDLRGMEFPDEPMLWITNVVRDGVRPWPGIDVRAFPIDGARHVAVVWTPPLATPPCITRGTVFERVPGASPAVKDPIRLAALYRRGDAARTAAERHVDTARRLLLADYQPPFDSRAHVGFVLAARATGYRDPDHSSRLFAPSFESAAGTAVNGLPSNHPPPLSRAQAFPEWSQNAIVWHRHSTWPHGFDWTMRVDWTGTIAIRWSVATDRVTPDDLVGRLVAEAWRTCLAMLAGLDAISSHYLSLTLLGRQFTDLTNVPFERHPDALPTLRRGPLDFEAAPDQLGSIEREIRRVLGEHAHEPERMDEDATEQ